MMKRIFEIDRIVWRWYDKKQSNTDHFTFARELNKLKKVKT